MAHGMFILSSGRESGQRAAPGGVIHGHGDCATSRVELGAVDDDSVPKTRPLGRLFSVGWHMSRCRAFLKNNRRQAQEMIDKDPAIRGARADQISKPECGFVENCNVEGGAFCKAGGLVTPSELGEHAFREREAGSKSVLKRQENEEASQIVELGSRNSPSDTKRAQDNIVHRAPSGEENFILGVPESTDTDSHRELGREISNTWLSTWLQNFDENQNVSRTDAESLSQADSGHLTYSPSTSHDTSSTTKLRVVNPSPPATFDSLNTLNLSARGIVTGKDLSYVKSFCTRSTTTNMLAYIERFSRFLSGYLQLQIESLQDLFPDAFMYWIFPTMKSEGFKDLENCLICEF